MSNRPANFFTQLAGVPVHYDRLPPQFPYGSRGKAMNFHSTPAFQQKLEACFQELWQVCPLGKAEVIASAGAFVAKPGFHGLGRAFDLDCIFWKDKGFITLHFPMDRRFYLGVDAVLRKHFGTVLNFHFDNAHRDHFHIDDGTSIGFFPGHKSRVAFLQMALTFLFETPVVIDRDIGPQTNGATREVLERLGLAQPSEMATAANLHSKLNAVWLQFLDKAIEAGFKGVTAAPVELNPLELLENVHELVERELSGHAARKQIETALTTFANHDATAAWLEQFR
jgi:hypothetical protein